jgi:hypothetical protein
MSKFVMIQAVPAPGFGTHGEAFRMWPGDRPIRVEVLDGEEDGPKVPVKRKQGDTHVIEEDHNPTVIGQRSYRALQANPRIRILSDGAVVAGAEIAAAKEDLQRMTAEKVAADGKNAELEADLLQLRGQVISLQEALKGATAGTDSEKTAAAVKSALGEQSKQFDAAYKQQGDLLAAAQAELAALKAPTTTVDAGKTEKGAGNGNGKTGKAAAAAASEGGK